MGPKPIRVWRGAQNWNLNGSEACKRKNNILQ